MTEIQNHTIRFYWPAAELLREVCWATAYDVRTLSDEKGQPLADRYTLTEDERPFVEAAAAEALRSLLQQFRRIIPDGCTVEAGGGVYALTVAAREDTNGRPLYGAAELAAADGVARSILCGLVLRDWFLSVHLADMAAVYVQRVQGWRAELSRLLFRLYRPAARASVSVAEPEREYRLDSGEIER